MVTETDLQERGESMPIPVRVPGELRDRAVKYANRRYTTLSELMRQALLEKLEREGA